MTSPRKSYYVAALDPSSAFYGKGYEENCEESGLRVPDDTDRANAWSCRAADGSDMHYPCFDVDVTLTVRQTGILRALFADCVMVPSSTAGHFHAYSDTALSWDDYWNALLSLENEGIIEAGYIIASALRGSTFVRMRHVKKRVES